MNEESISWLESQKKFLNERRAEIDKVELLVDKVSIPATNKLEAVERLKNLLEWWGILPQHGPFPMKSIMEELLMDQDYKVFSYPNGRDAYFVNGFEMELIPSSRSSILKVKCIGVDGKGRDEPLPVKDKRFSEFDIIMQNSGRLEIANKLTKLSYELDGTVPTIGITLKRTWNNYIDYSDRINEINLNFRELMEEDKEMNQNRREKVNIETAKSLNSLKKCGLFETFELISANTTCFVNFDIFIGAYSINNGIKEANDFIGKYDTEN